MPGSPPRRSRHNCSLMTATGGRSRFSSSRVRARPTIVWICRTSNSVPDARRITTCAASPAPVSVDVRQSIAAMDVNDVARSRQISKWRMVAGSVG